jgi:hypothetical protein
MQYLLMLTDIDGRWDALPAAEQARIMAGHEAFHAALRDEGRYVTSFRLRPPREARTVRFATDDGRSVSDGPFTETKEVMGGFYVIEAGSMDEAVAWARRVPLAYGSVEVRPVWA